MSDAAFQLPLLDYHFKQDNVSAIQITEQNLVAVARWARGKVVKTWDEMGNDLTYVELGGRYTSVRGYVGHWVVGRFVPASSEIDTDQMVYHVIDKETFAEQYEQDSSQAIARNYLKARTLEGLLEDMVASTDNAELVVQDLYALVKSRKGESVTIQKESL